MVELAEPENPDALALQLGTRTCIQRFRGLEIHALAAEEAPLVMLELGRLREKEFRAAGAGRNLPRDLDELDYGPHAYTQLLAWDPQAREIVAAYRYLICADLLPEPGLQALRTARLFSFRPELESGYLPYAVELGRSFVNRSAKKAYMGLFAAWVGLGALAKEYPFLRYYYGNFTLYQSYSRESAAHILAFLEAQHGTPRPLLEPRPGLAYSRDDDSTGLYRGEYAAARARRGLVYLGTAADADFGGALECAILVPTEGLHPKTRAHFLDGYVSENPQRFIDLRKRSHHA
jgi:hypothetical protein